jgi:hypothetical protein
MFLFGHLGIGSLLAQPWSKKLPKTWILVGTVLPDMIDKTLYYSLSTLTGKHGAELEFITGTRTVGHTLIFFILLTGVASIRKSKVGLALALGTATHLFLDSLFDGILHPDYLSVPLFWPLPNGKFPIYPHSGIAAHLATGRQTPILIGEVVGLFLILRSWRRAKKTSCPQPRL